MDFDQKLAQVIDFAVLNADATREDIGYACQLARQYNFAAVCVNPYYVSLAASLLNNTRIKICAVVGFPLGANISTVKAIEARNVVTSGATEIDMMLNIGALKSGAIELVEEEITMVRSATKGLVLKVILETCLLTKEEKIKASQLAQKSGVNFIKTSTGFSKHGATVEDIKLIRQTVGIEMGVKASGGIDSAEKAYNLLAAGATRIGTSHAEKIILTAKQD